MHSFMYAIHSRFVHVCILLAASLCSNAQFKLEKIWESDSTLRVPESVLLDQEGNYYMYPILMD